MVLPKYKKIFLLFFLFVFVGNILFAPFIAKAEDAGTPTPTNDFDWINKGSVTQPQNFKIADGPTKKTDTTYDIKFTWTKPRAGATVTFYGNTKMADYQFTNYHIKEIDPSNKEIEITSGKNFQYTDTGFSYNLTIESGSNKTYQFYIYSEYTLTKFYSGDPSKILMSSATVPIATTINTATGQTSTGQSAYQPTLSAKNNNPPIYLTGTYPAQGTPYGFSLFRANGSGSMQLLSDSDAELVKGTSSFDFIDNSSTQLANNLSNGSSLTLTYAVKANFPDTAKIDTGWGWSNTVTVKIAKDAQGNINTTSTQNNTVANSSNVQPVTSDSESGGKISCGCKDGFWDIKKAVCDTMCWGVNAMADAVHWSTDTFLFASIKDDKTSSTPKGLAGDFSTPHPDDKKWIFTIWNFSLNLVNAFLIAVLIFLAFVNILRIQIDTYAIKKILPMLVLGVIFANFSMLICRAIIDFSDMLTKAFAGDLNKITTNLIGALGVPLLKGDLTSTISGFPVIGSLVAGSIDIVKVILAALITIIIFGAVFVGTFILAFLLWIRIPIVSILVAFSPLAFIAMTFPITQKYFTMWWGQFLNWVFMLPVIMLLFRIVSLFDFMNNQFDFAAYVVALIIIYIAIQVPFKMGGAVMASWSTFGKKLAGGAWQGYGSTFATMAKSKNKTLSWMGKNLSAYGTGTALKERFELMEKKRIDTYKEGKQYEIIAGYEAAAKFKRKDTAESIGGINDVDTIDDLLLKRPGSYSTEGYKKLQKHLASLKDDIDPATGKIIRSATDKQEEFLQKMLYGSGSQHAQAGEQAKLSTDELAFVSNLLSRKQKLMMSRRRQVSLRGCLPMGKAGISNNQIPSSNQAQMVNQFTQQLQAQPNQPATTIGQNFKVNIAPHIIPEITKLQNTPAANLMPDQHELLTQLQNLHQSFGHVPEIDQAIAPVLKIHAAPKVMVNESESFKNLTSDAKNQIENLLKGSSRELDDLKFDDLKPEVLLALSPEITTRIPKALSSYLDNGKIKSQIRDGISKEKNSIQSTIQNEINGLNMPDLNIKLPSSEINLKMQTKVNADIDTKINQTDIDSKVKQRLQNLKNHINEQFNKLGHIETAEKSMNNIENSWGNIQTDIHKKMGGGNDKK